jgi:hypothetical protein
MSPDVLRGLQLSFTLLIVLSAIACGGSDEDSRSRAFPRVPLAGSRASGGVFGGTNGGFSQPAPFGGNGSVPTPIAGPSSATPSVCASALVRTAKNMPTIVFVIDGSGSMCAPFGGGGTRWQALRSALLDPMRGLIFRLQNIVSFGISIYDGTIDLALALTAEPLPAAGGAPAGGQSPPCALAYANTKTAGMCPAQVNVLPPALNNAPMIDAAFPRVELGGSTPTDRALGTVMDQLIAGIQNQGPDQKAVSPVYVILATDGAPNDICVGGVGGDGSAQRQGVISAVDRGAAAGITTWVISLAGGDQALQAHLDEVARHGEPKNPMAKTFAPTDPDGLIKTLAALLGGAVGCNINLNGRVTVGQECSGTVTLGTSTLACCQQPAPGGAFMCDGAAAPAPNGWRLQNDNAIELLGDSCTKFLIGADTALDATFPCDVFRPL